ncbi:hypothetical protein G6F68_018671 [Rhizopus microsporus]|nr:hypothetical protein G6F32_016110 [Rhizopus arrhizus]KAG1239287.1 hypothetical protein G6F68_018671 [Rhizopus microsporus]
MASNSSSLIHLPVGDEDELLRAADGIGHRLHRRAAIGVGVNLVAAPHRRELAVRWRVVVTAAGALLPVQAGQCGMRDAAQLGAVCHHWISLRWAGSASICDWNSYSARCR